MKTAIIIPARMAAQRLPNKPLALINGKAMIEHAWNRAVESRSGDVFVACDGDEIANVIKSAGGMAVITNPEIPTGTDRIFSAFSLIGGDYDIIVNLQGDLPNIDPNVIKETVNLLKNNSEFHISTAAAKMVNKDEIENVNVVKAAISIKDGESCGNGMYFSRNPIKASDGNFYHHIGIYGFRNDSLKRFVSLPQSPIEKMEKLEQLRALDNRMRIGVTIVNAIPLSVDTQEDLDRVRNFMR